MKYLYLLPLLLLGCAPDPVEPTPPPPSTAEPYWYATVYATGPENTHQALLITVNSDTVDVDAFNGGWLGANVWAQPGDTLRVSTHTARGGGQVCLRARLWRITSLKLDETLCAAPQQWATATYILD